METEQSTQRNEELYLTKKAWWKRPFPWIAVVIVLAGGGTYAVVRQHTKKTAAPLYQIRYIQARTGTVAQTVSISGTLEPINQATVSASGTLQSVSVKVGQKVKEGQVIAHMDTSSLDLQLELAKAQLASADAKLAQANETTTTTVKGKTQTTQPNPNVVAEDQASVDQANAKVVSIENQIAACTVKSPIAGTVMTVANPASTSTVTISTTSSGSGSSGAKGGNSSSKSIASITDLSSSDFEVQANVAQADVSKIHPGQRADISMSSIHGPRLVGTVESLQLIPHTSSGVTTYPVIVKVNKPAGSGVTMLPGANVSVVIVEKQARNVVTVPTAALVQRRGQVGVYEKTTGSSSANGRTTSGSASGTQTSKGGTRGHSSNSQFAAPANLQFHPVTVGLYGGNTVQIKNGLQAGQQVALVLPSSSQSSSTGSSAGRRGFGLGGGFARFAGGGLGGGRRFAGGGTRGSRGGGKAGGGKSGGGNG
ncbi:efflux RND transporter periplasmic adaptor subunit [Alicyclobacillus sp. SO9]|uniref:efflux RND transporter periplasmic adaptor subunit n=1 Tax=Alicyclobacillus sp. SO9 TaxID=2665646 RepID=UPI0018E77083|nr:biotin/lipoyl-binding protein [Alicyclobacillus sp. SO9]QQE80651.1 biotin/lipoyl-binding protein [Alicyclobacillus sp. SO9]